MHRRKKAQLIAAFIMAAASPLALAEGRAHGTISVHGVAKTQYAQLAKISVREAEAAALAAVPGKVITTKLESEDGYLAYSVKIRQDSGAVAELEVDAGDGKILGQESDDDGGDDDDD